jgi:hypothetical protein
MSTLWHYIQNGNSQGPVPEEQLQGLLSAGTLRPTDLVWREGMGNWTAIQELPELARPVAPPIQPVAPPIQPPALAPVPAPVPVNPYVAPQANVAAPILQAPAQIPGSVSEDAVEYLRKTKPWVRFLAILGIIGMILMVLGGIAMVVIGGSAFHYVGGLPMRIGMALVYIVLAILYFPPLLFLNRYASRIGDLVNDHSTESLEAALRAQKSFWKYVGVFTLILMGVYALVLIGFLVTALVMGMGKGVL